jgi:hypothetical protein
VSSTQEIGWILVGVVTTLAVAGLIAIAVLWQRSFARRYWLADETLDPLQDQLIVLAGAPDRGR